MKTMRTLILEKELFELGQAMYQTEDWEKRFALALRREAILAELRADA